MALFSTPGQDVPPQLLSFDKAAHAGLFALLGVLWMRVRPQRWPWVLLGGTGFAVGTELYQGLLPWERFPDPYDALADTVGLVLGVGAYSLRARRFTAPGTGAEARDPSNFRRPTVSGLNEGSDAP